MKKLTWALLGAAALTLLGAPTLAQATESSETVEVYWLMPEGSTPDNVGWPQALLATEELQCEAWYQVDTYPVEEAAIFTADGVLTLGEDYASETQRGALQWRFEQGPACEVELPPTEPPVVPETPAVPPEQPAVVPEAPAEAVSVAVVEEAPQLAETGADLTWAGWAAALLLGAGGAVLLGLRHKKA